MYKSLLTVDQTSPVLANVLQKKFCLVILSTASADETRRTVGRNIWMMMIMAFRHCMLIFSIDCDVINGIRLNIDKNISISRMGATRFCRSET